MKITNRTVHIYADQDTLIAIPTRKSKKYGLKELSFVNEIGSISPDIELERILYLSLSQCFSEEANDSSEIGALEVHLNIKGYVKAVKNKKLIALEWDCDDGYYVVPTRKIPKQGFVDIEDKIIRLGKKIVEGELAKAVRQAIELSS